uniref:Uncharacterized protein n=1 Tax=Hyaloperonospora arabidopsidis (strain Emoy2) TaxID=559515 RepID=M4BWG2_HYAAE
MDVRDMSCLSDRPNKQRQKDRPTDIDTNTCGKNSNGSATGCHIERKRAIPLCEVKEIREGHTTKAFSSIKSIKTIPPPDICLSIICAWRTSTFRSARVTPNGNRRTTRTAYIRRKTPQSELFVCSGI